MTLRVHLSANNANGSSCLRRVHRSGSTRSAIVLIREEENEEAGQGGDGDAEPAV